MAEDLDLGCFLNGKKRSTRNISIHKRTLSKSGANELRVLSFLNNHSGRVNKQKHSASIGMAKTTFSDTLNRLERKGFAVQDHMGGCYNLTRKGKLVVENIPTATTRKPIKADELSTHKQKYYVKIKDRSSFSPDLIKKLNPISFKPLNNLGFTQYYAVFDGVTIILNKDMYYVNVHDVVSDGTSDSSMKSLDLVYSYVDKLNNFGLIPSTISLEEGHWAEVEGVLAETFRKIDEKFEVNLSDGSRVFLDKSLGSNEFETSKEEIMRKMQRLVQQVDSSSAEFKEIDDLKSLAKDMVALHAMQEETSQMLKSDLLEISGILKDVATANHNTALGLQNLTHKVSGVSPDVNKTPTVDLPSSEFADYFS